MDEKATFAHRFKELCAEKTQQEIADALMITRASVGYYINNKRSPDIEMLSRIASLFDVSADYLIGLSDTKRPENNDISSRSGLSESSIEKICSIKERNADIISVFDKMISTLTFELLLIYIDEYLQCTGDGIAKKCTFDDSELSEINKMLSKYGHTSISCSEKANYLEYKAVDAFSGLLSELTVPCLRKALESRMNNNGND